MHCQIIKNTFKTKIRRKTDGLCTYSVSCTADKVSSDSYFRRLVANNERMRPLSDLCQLGSVLWVIFSSLTLLTRQKACFPTWHKNVPIITCKRLPSGKKNRKNNNNYLLATQGNWWHLKRVYMVDIIAIYTAVETAYKIKIQLNWKKKTEAEVVS